MKIISKILVIILISLLFSTTVFAADVLKFGSRGQEVVQVQQTLKEKGYFNYRITGYYGTITENSIIAFQKANNITIDGIAGPETLSKLYMKNSNLLKYGSSGSNVSNLQQKLKNIGFFNFPNITGYYGPITKKAVINFQKAYGLTVDGIAGPQTFNKLYSISYTNNTKNNSSEDLYWLSRIIEAESKGEPYNGKIAVGSVVMNRVKSQLFPNTVKGVIFEYYKGIPMFSPVQNGKIYNNPSNDSIKAAREVLNGVSNVGNATYFYNPDKAQSTWISNNKTYICRIGNHVFYG